MKDILIYDGDCGICTAIVEWIGKRDIHRKIEIIPNQSPDAAKHAPVLTESMMQKSVYFKSRGRYYKGARAIFKVLSRLGGFIGLAGRIISIKAISFLFEPFYKLVASNRTRISRYLGMKACRMRERG